MLLSYGIVKARASCITLVKKKKKKKKKKEQDLLGRVDICAPNSAKFKIQHNAVLHTRLQS